MAAPARSPAALRTIVALAVAMSLALLGDMLLYTVLPSQPEVAGIGAAALGLVLSVHRFVRLATNSVSGVLYDRFDCRQLYLLGMALAVASTTGYLVSSTLPSLVVARITWGAAFSLISVGGLSIILESATVDARGRAVGVYQSAVSFGTLVQLALGGALTDLLGYRGTLAIFAPLTAVGWLVAYVLLPASRTARPPLSSLLVRRVPVGDIVRPHDSDAVVGLAALVARLRTVSPRALAPVYVSFVGFFGINGVMMSTLGLSLRQRAQTTGGGGMPVASLTGLLLALRRLASLVVAPAAGYLYDRTRAPRLVATIGVLASIAGFAIMAASVDVTTAIPGVLLTALGEGILAPALTAWTGELAPPGVRGVVVGLYATANDLGGALGPLVGYALAGGLGLPAAYWLCTALFVTAMLVLATVRAR